MKHLKPIILAALLCTAAAFAAKANDFDGVKIKLKHGSIVISDESDTTDKSEGVVSLNSSSGHATSGCIRFIINGWEASYEALEAIPPKKLTSITIYKDSAREMFGADNAIVVETSHKNKDRFYRKFIKKYLPAPTPSLSDIGEIDM